MTPEMKKENSGELYPPGECSSRDRSTDVGTLNPAARLASARKVEPQSPVVPSFEGFVRAASSVVARLEDLLSAAPEAALPASLWDEDLESLKKLIVPRVTIALSGSTGSGKSTLINAVLNDSIVSTSGMEACTAVVTEISYHDKKTIIGKVEFLLPEEWKEEITLLLSDLKSDKKKNILNGDSTDPVVIAYKKVQAVYPALKLDALEKMTVDDVINHNEEVAKLLGTVTTFEAENSDEFQVLRERYMQSSQLRSTSSSSTSALWPLVKCFKVYCNAAALSTGAVIVDLPGAGDANAARSAVAGQYLKGCDCVWVLSQATRALDDKCAKDLIDMTLKNRLINGALEKKSTNAITIIATKCDDVEASELVSIMNEEQRAKYNQMRHEMVELDKARVCLEAQATAEENQLYQMVTQNALKTLGMEKSGQDSSQKRPAESELGAPSKRQKISATEAALARPTSLSEWSAFGQRLFSLASMETNARRQVTNVKDKIAEIQREINSSSALIRAEVITRKMKDTVQAEFQKSRETSVNEEDFDPDAEDEDDKYAVDAINEDCLLSLKVLASSARDYMKMTGQVVGPPTTFSTLEETQIPAIQEQCHALAAVARAEVAGKFMNKLEPLLKLLISHLSREELGHVAQGEREALRLRWVTVRTPSAKGEPMKAGLSKTSSSKSSGRGPTTSGLAHELENACFEVISHFTKALKRHFRKSAEERLFRAGTVAAGTAKSVLDTTLKHLVWATFRALLRHRGEWKDVDLSAILADEMLSLIAKDWRTLFSVTFFEDKLKKLHDVVDRRLDKVVASVPQSLEADARKMADDARAMAYVNIRNLIEDVRKHADEEQKDTDRVLCGCIKGFVKPVLRRALGVTGKGSIAIQKAQVPADIHKCGEQMYKESAEQILQQLDDIAAGTGQFARKKAKKICRNVETSMSKLWADSVSGGTKIEESEQTKALVRLTGDLKEVSSHLSSLRFLGGLPISAS